MMTRKTWPLLAVALAALLSFLFPINPQTEAGQDKEPAQKKLYFGVKACVNCHDKESAYDFNDNDKYPPFTACNEMRKREPADKHVIAYQVLLSERAKDMGKILKISTSVSEAKQCLACHASLGDPKDSTVELDSSFNIEEGVSCVACHGATLPQEKFFNGWLDFHKVSTDKVRTEWRALPRKEKDKEFGMYDLWHPIRRARLCASCHIGNLAEGKVVTHEMYAAGHPPLPSFEVATFSDQMPHHWQHLREKYQEQSRATLLKKVLHLTDTDADLEELHLLAAGSLVTLEASMDLMAGQARRDWPELAQFDCYACHHELKTKSWRAERGYAGKPGHVPARPWITALLDLGIAHVSLDDARAGEIGRQFQADWQPFQATLDRQPFGDAAQVAASADKIAAWAKGQLSVLDDNLKNGKYTRASGQRLWDRLLALQKRKTPDYDSARQIGWALEVLARNVLPSNKAKKFKAGPAWQSLDTYLKLTLPTDKIAIKPPGNMPWLTFRPAPLEKALPDALERINSYEPMEFQKRWAEFQRGVRDEE